MLGLRLNVIMSCVLVFLLHNVFSPSVKDTSSTSNVSYTVGVHPRLDQEIQRCKNEITATFNPHRNRYPDLIEQTLAYARYAFTNLTKQDKNTIPEYAYLYYMSFGPHLRSNNIPQVSVFCEKYISNSIVENECVDGVLKIFTTVTSKNNLFRAFFDIDDDIVQHSKSKNRYATEYFSLIHRKFELHLDATEYDPEFLFPNEFCVIEAKDSLNDINLNTDD